MRKLTAKKAAKSLSDAQLSVDAVFRRLHEANLTVLGRFNPAIIEPGWIVREKVATEEAFVMLVPVGDGPTVYASEDDWGWMISPDRLVVFGPSDKAVGFVERLLTLLPHTPITAAGVNFQRRAQSVGDFKPYAKTLKGLMRGTNVVEAVEARTFRMVGETIVRVQRTVRATDSQLDYNFHLETTDWKQVVTHCKRIHEFKAIVDEQEKDG